MAKTQTNTEAQSPAFSALVDLMAVASEAASRLSEIQAEIDQAYLDLVDEYRSEYAVLQSAASAAEGAAEQHCRAHPEWFARVKTLTTPYGKVALRSVASLEVKNEEATARLIRAVFPDRAEELLRVREEPNLEALETLPDEDLRRVMVRRVAGESFKFTPAKIDMGKAPKSEPDTAGKN